MRTGLVHDRADAACMNPTPSRRRPAAIGGALGALMALHGLPVLAQSATDTVVVTGSARAQRAFDLPFAIATVDAQALHDAGPMINLSEGLVRVPGLVVNNRNNYAQDLQISSRGFGARAAFGVRGLRLYTDGIPATSPDGQGQVAHFDLAGAQRIEVLRGPFSVLYGNSSGGVIALFTAPARQPQSEAAVDLGSFGLRQGRVSVATPLGQGFDIRANATALTLDGFRPQSAAERSLGNVRVGWQGSADTVTLLLSGQRQDAQDPLGLSREQFDADPLQTTEQALQFNTRKTIDQVQGGVNWRHAFDDLGPLRESSLTLYDGLREISQWQAILPAAQLNPRSGGGVVGLTRHYHGGEAKLALRWGEADIVAGLVIETLKDDRLGFENFIGVGADQQLGVTGKLRRDEINRAETKEAFVQAQWPLSASLSLTGGLRGGRVDLSTTDFYLSNGNDSGAMGFDYVNPVLGLRWMVQPDWALHAGVARGFESPTVAEVAYRPDGQPGFNTALKGQTGQQLELGSKWRRAAVDVDAAVFLADTEDEISVLTNSGGRSTYQNVSRTRRYGLELAGAWRISSNLRLQAAATWLHAAYRDGFLTCVTTPCLAPRVPVAAGNRIAGTQAASAWVEAAWRPPGQLGEAALEWRVAGPTAVNDVNSGFAGGYALLNLRWSQTIALGAVDGIELLARLDNAFDRVYAGSVIVNESNARFYETGAPRNALLSVRWLHRW
jgi:iron complex outermembrane recepter protein